MVARRLGYQRVTSEDLVLLATDVGPAPMQVGAILRLSSPLGYRAATEELGRRIASIPRLRQRLEQLPPGCGRPIWVDDPTFSMESHLHAIRAPEPGDDASLLEVASEVLCTPLPRDRPLWRIALVEGLADGSSAMVVVFHHLLSDGIGGLAMLATLVDGVEQSIDQSWPLPRPSTFTLVKEAALGRLLGITRLPSRMRRLRFAAAQLRPSGAKVHVSRTSLNVPCGSRRRLAVVRVPLEGVLAHARSHGATVNDVVLAAVSLTLGELMHRRGENLDALVVSVPVSARDTSSGNELGNQVGAVPVELPTRGSDEQLIRATVAATARAKEGVRGASSAFLVPLFRALAALHLFRWFVEHQHMVNTFVTNLKGPSERLQILGVEITDVAAVTVVPGNVSVCFAVLSYAGTLGVTVVADPDSCDDLDGLTAGLQEHLDRMTRGPVE